MVDAAADRIFELLDRNGKQIRAPLALLSRPPPPHEGLTVEINAGYPETSYYDRRATRVLPLLFLCKSNDKQIAFDTLCSLKNNLEQLPEYPSGISFKWVKVDTKEPDYVGEQGGHIWACVIDAVIYF